MTNEKNLFAEERQHEILKLLTEQSKIYVTDLCDTFGVSSATIRNDLREMEANALLKRTHGGAILDFRTSFEPDSTQKVNKNAEQKERIAQQAAQYIEDGDTIMLDTGTTTERIVPYLSKKKNITVVVNDIQIARRLEDETTAQVILIGGTLKRGFHCSVGPLTTNAIRSLNVEKAFIGTNGLCVEKGLTTPDINHAEVKKAMISVAAKVFVMCDSSKIGKLSFCQFADLQQVDILLTDSEILPGTIVTLKDACNGLEIMSV